MTFDEYLTFLGFSSYPFAVYTAEGEMDFLEKTYVLPDEYSTLVQALKSTSAIIIGERGTGKTALSLELQKRMSDSSFLIVSIDELSDLSLDYNTSSLYEFFLGRMVVSFFDKFSTSPQVLWRLSVDERKDLSFFLSEYVGASTKQQLTEKISKIQNGLLKRSGLFLYNTFRGFLNYGIGALTKVASDAITRHFSALPAITQNDVEYFRKASIEVDQSFTPERRTYYYLEKFSALSKKIGVNSIIVFVDKVDEDPRLKNDAEIISNYLKTALSDNKLLTSNFFNVAFFVWSTPFNNIRGDVRTQKISLESLDWSIDKLRLALVKRVNAFMIEGKEIGKSADLFSEGTEFDQVAIFEMANGNPRDLWHLLNRCFKAQFSINPNEKISAAAIQRALRDHVLEFNYYEYYPRKASARADTMDVYSYIAHLQKMNEVKFTKNRLNKEAGTGSSTNSYVVAMENMGLVKKTAEKGENGAVIYAIKDPKVRYAIDKSIEIVKH